jgi:predicted amidohydrolase YtcJ
MLLFNGKIVTLDDTSSINGALAITGDHITAMDAATKCRLAGAATKIIDLGGRTIHGLIDSHVHSIRASRLSVC